MAHSKDGSALYARITEWRKDRSWNRIYLYSKISTSKKKILNRNVEVKAKFSSKSKLLTATEKSLKDSCIGHFMIATLGNYRQKKRGD